MRATADWDGGWWTAKLDEHENVFTQAKRFELLPGLLSEVTHLMLGKTVEPQDFEVSIEHATRAGQVAAEVRVMRASVAAQEQQLADLSREAIQELQSEGMSMRDIGAMTGLSYQRVHQVIDQSRKALGLGA